MSAKSVAPKKPSASCGGPLPEAAVARLGAQLLEALDYCHQHQVLHRDIKPNNIILLPDGAPVLVDFGLVKLWNPANPTTHTLMRGMGTPHYASPEQYGFAAGHTDARSDIYSVGATLYYTLTAQAPPVATDRMLRPELMAPLAAVAPWLSPNMAGAVSQALELQPDARFAGAAAMRAALLGTAAGGPRMAAGPLPSAARVTTVMPPPAPARQRFILPAALAGVALLVVVGFLAWRVLVDGSSGRGPTPPATAARGQGAWASDEFAVDEGAVTAAQVAQQRPGRRWAHFGVQPGDGRVVKLQVGRRIAADDKHRCLAQFLAT